MSLYTAVEGPLFGRWVYIKSHNLQETTDKRNIKPDAVLGKKSTLVARIEPIG